MALASVAESGIKRAESGIEHIKGKATTHSGAENANSHTATLPAGGIVPGPSSTGTIQGEVAKTGLNTGPDESAIKAMTKEQASSALVVQQQRVSDAASALKVAQDSKDPAKIAAAEKDFAQAQATQKALESKSKGLLGKVGDFAANPLVGIGAMVGLPMALSAFTGSGSSGAGAGSGASGSDPTAAGNAAAGGAAPGTYGGAAAGGGLTSEITDPMSGQKLMVTA